MQKELIGLAKSNQLPYTPIQFTFSESIGSKKTELQSKHIYPHEFKDILTPRILTHHNPIFYLLFHTPTVYNWIRTIKTNQSRLLDTYIRTNISSKDNATQQGPLVLNLLKTSLVDYVKKWEVTKLAFCHRVYIKRQINGDSCTHLCKTQVYTHEVEYIPKLKAFIYPQILCKECQTSYKFQCQTRQLSHYMVVSNPTQPVITLAKEKVTYSLYFLMSDKLVYIKCANKVWYEVNPSLKTVKPIGFSMINIRNMKIGAYSQPITQSQSLKIAQPLFDLEYQKAQALKKDEMQIQEDRPTQTLFSNKNPAVSTHAQIKEKPKKSLKQLKSKSSQVLLREKSKDYIQSVSKLYIQPKVKDQYELGYDKGKLKKKKQKKQYIKPDFNQIYQQLKTAVPVHNEPQKMSKKIKKNKNKSKFAESEDDQ